MEYYERKRLIKIIRNVILIIILGVVWHIYATSPSKAYRGLNKYLKNKYGEEFVIGYMGKRRVNSREWYEAGVVYPKSYIGTVKENDTYYWGRGFAEIKGVGLDIGDNYGGVLLNESANEFYGKKLKELFGENVLPVLKIEGEYKYTDFLKEYLREEKTISGGIYIFGRVENDEDREWYRKQIYEFVQFMKQTGTFEYVDLGITVIDERELVNLDNPHKYIENLSNDLDKETWRKERRRLMKNGDEEFVKLSKDELQNRINSLNKGSYDDSGFINLLFTRIYSPKYIKSKGWNESNRKELYEEIKEYNSIEDITFKMEWW